MVETDRVNIRVESPSGAPIARAIVVVRTAVLEQDHVNLAAREELFKGMTDADGRVSGPLVRRATDDKLDVAVLMPGFVGPYTEPAKLEYYGAAAPASWQVVEASRVTDMSIPLRPVEVSQ